MSTLAARTIDALRTEHEGLVDQVASLPTDQLTAPSGASEWTVAQVLSHLGSGAEISLASLHSALGQREVPADDFNRGVWARWDSMSPTEHRDRFIEHNQAFVEALTSLTAEQHESVRVALAFLPAPLTIAGFAGMRLNEVAHHTWDVRVAFNPDATLLPSSAEALVDHLAGDLAFLLGFIARADQVDHPVTLAVADTGYYLAIDDSVRLHSGSTERTAKFSGPVEAALRMITGRLGPVYTPAHLTVTGNVTLDELRRVFPGF